MTRQQSSALIILCLGIAALLFVLVVEQQNKIGDLATKRESASPGVKAPREPLGRAAEQVAADAPPTPTPSGGVVVIHSTDFISPKNYQPQNEWTQQSVNERYRAVGEYLESKGCYGGTRNGYFYVCLPESFGYTSREDARRLARTIYKCLPPGAWVKVRDSSDSETLGEADFWGTR